MDQIDKRQYENTENLQLVVRGAFQPPYLIVNVNCEPWPPCDVNGMITVHVIAAVRHARLVQAAPAAITVRVLTVTTTRLINGHVITACGDAAIVCVPQAVFKADTVSVNCGPHVAHCEIEVCPH